MAGRMVQNVDIQSLEGGIQQCPLLQEGEVFHNIIGAGGIFPRFRIIHKSGVFFFQGMGATGAGRDGIAAGTFQGPDIKGCFPLKAFIVAIGTKRNTATFLAGQEHIDSVMVQHGKRIKSDSGVYEINGASRK